MTIREALRDRVRCIRLPEWEPSAHIELPLFEDGRYGPWATVRDVSGEIQVFLALLTQEATDRYVEWHDPRAV